MLLDAKAVHTGRTARNHLLRARRDPRHRRRRASTRSSRSPASDPSPASARAASPWAWGSASASPRRCSATRALLILDEPVNGLDPEGVLLGARVRSGMPRARDARCSLSSHLMSEMAQTADHIIVLGRGRVLADAPLPELVRAWTTARVHVRSPRAAELAAVIAGRDVEIVTTSPDTLDVAGLESWRIGDLAAERGIPVHELTPTSGSLEDAYLALTGESVEYRTRAVPDDSAPFEEVVA